MDQIQKQIESMGGLMQQAPDVMEIIFDNVTIDADFVQKCQAYLKNISIQVRLVISNCATLNDFVLLDDESKSNLEDITSIIAIKIENCPVKELPKGLRIFNNIHSLIFHEADLAGSLETLDGISMFPKLGRIEISGHRFESISNDLGTLSKSLHTIVLKNNMLSSVPRIIGSFYQLTLLDLSYNKIVTVDPSIGNLRNLRQLHLQHNLIEIIPEEIGTLTQLEYLNLSNCKLTGFIQNIQSLSKLVELHLENNPNLSYLPVDMENLPALDDFYYHNTKIMDTPAKTINIMEDDLDGYKEQLLDLSNKEFNHETLKEHLFAMRGTISQLQIDYEADLSHNQMKTLPDNFGVIMKDVGSLHLSFNSQFENFGGQLLLLTRLKWLYLDGIAVSDDSIQQLTQFVENSNTISYIVGLNITEVSLHEKIRFVNAVSKNQAKNVSGIKRINGMSGTPMYPLSLRILDKIGTLDDSRYKKLVSCYRRSVHARNLHRKAATCNNKLNTVMKTLTVLSSFAATVVSFSYSGNESLDGILSAISTLFISLSAAMEFAKRYASHKYAAKVYDNLATSIDFQINYPTKDVQTFAHEVEKTMIEINDDVEYFPKDPADDKKCRTRQKHKRLTTVSHVTDERPSTTGYRSSSASS